MAAFFPNGTIFSLSITLAAATTTTAVTNANPGVATSTAHGYSNADILLLTASSSRLDNRVVRVAGQTTNTWNLEGIDTSSATQYPAGFGVGTARKATAFVPLSQVTDTQTSGGEQQFYQWTYLEDGRQRQRPTFKNARAMQIELDWDSSLAWHTTLLAADYANEPYPLLASLPSGRKIYYGVYVGYDGEPDFVINQNQKTRVTFALACPFTTLYAS